MGKYWFFQKAEQAALPRLFVEKAKKSDFMVTMVTIGVPTASRAIQGAIVTVVTTKKQKKREW